MFQTARVLAHARGDPRLVVRKVDSARFRRVVTTTDAVLRVVVHVGEEGGLYTGVASVAQGRFVAAEAVFGR